MNPPIFIFSMPRSGSTLLQRVLSSHELIGTSPEPWLLLPLIYSKKEKGTISEYSTLNATKAINDLLNITPNGNILYNESIKDFAYKIYANLLIGNEMFFLDKTPRYYLIIDEIYTIFPDAKFIFLFRNPTHIYSSILNTWCNNKFIKLYGNHNDLTNGFSMLSNCYEKHKENKNTVGLKYEDFVQNPSLEIDKLLDFLNINKDDNLTQSFIKNNIQTVNNDFLGDTTGIHKYKTISQKSLNKWKETFNTRVRKYIISKFIIKTFTEKDLSIQGYSKNEILKEIKHLNNKGKYNPFVDFIQYIGYKLIIKFNLYLFFGKNLNWVNNKFLS